MKHHGHGDNHGRDHHRRERGHCRRFGKFDRHFKHHGPHNENESCVQRPKEQGGFRRYGNFTRRCLSESDAINFASPNTQEQIKQIVRMFFRRGHHLGRGSTICAAKENSGSENEGKTGGYANQCHHRHHRHGRREHRWFRCGLKGRNSDGSDSSTEGKDENASHTSPEGGHHQRNMKHHGHRLRRHGKCCTEQGRSSQEDTSSSEVKDKKDGNEKHCKGSHHHGRHWHHHLRRRGPGRFGRHGRCIILLDESTTTDNDKETNKEVSDAAGPSAPTVENMTIAAEENQDDNQATELEKIANDLKDSKLD